VRYIAGVPIRNQKSKIENRKLEWLKKGREHDTMSAVLKLEQEVAQLAPQDLARFRKWFEEFDAQMWDKQFEHDAQSGKLDKLANQAIADFRAGKYKKL